MEVFSRKTRQALRPILPASEQLFTKSVRKRIKATPALVKKIREEGYALKDVDVMVGSGVRITEADFERFKEKKSVFEKQKRHYDDEKKGSDDGKTEESAEQPEEERYNIYEARTAAHREEKSQDQPALEQVESAWEAGDLPERPRSQTRILIDFEPLHEVVARYRRIHDDASPEVLDFFLLAVCRTLAELPEYNVQRNALGSCVPADAIALLVETSEAVVSIADAGSADLKEMVKQVHDTASDNDESDDAAALATTFGISWNCDATEALDEKRTAVILTLKEQSDELKDPSEANGMAITLSRHPDVGNAYRDCLFLQTLKKYIQDGDQLFE